MILITGAGGFIGSALIWKLNNEGLNDIIAVDNFGTSQKWKNLRKYNFLELISKDILFDWIDNYNKKIDVIIHLGACTDTKNYDVDFLLSNNYRYSQKLWKICVEKDIRFIYASSAATYGDGGLGFKDEEKLVTQLKSLNPYGFSKQLFDQWVVKQKQTPSQWIGLKFFNVYGPNEYHKGEMSSFIYQAYQQVITNKKIKLFKSYYPKYKDGQQQRDFIYIKDVVDVINFFFSHEDRQGLYNVGTGEASTFNNLAKTIFNTIDANENIQYIEMPVNLKKKYQYYTKADISKLQEAGYKSEFYSLEEGIVDYVQNYLEKEDAYL